MDKETILGISVHPMVDEQEVQIESEVEVEFRHKDGKVSRYPSRNVIRVPMEGIKGMIKGLQLAQRDVECGVALNCYIAYYPPMPEGHDPGGYVVEVISARDGHLGYLKHDAVQLPYDTKAEAKHDALMWEKADLDAGYPGDGDTVFYEVVKAPNNGASS